MRATEFLSEGKNHPVIVVDVQPAYASSADFDEMFHKIIDFVAVKQTGPVLMFVNAEETGITDDTIADVEQYWENSVSGEDDSYEYDDADDDYVEKDTSINWSRFDIVDKGYGYFRAWQDTGVPENVIIKVIRLMYQQRVTDSRELFDGEDSEDYVEKMTGLGVPEEMLSDGLSVEWTSVSQLKQFNGAYIVGGGRNECLREVELLMNAFNIRYKRIDSLVYG